MASSAGRPVVILYEHALLGEGIARYVLSNTGVEPTIVHVNDRDAVTAALASDPALIIFELSEPLMHGDLATLAPDAVLIDVSRVVARGIMVSPTAAGLEAIGQAVRSISTTA